MTALDEPLSEMSDLEQKLSGLGLGRPAAVTVGTFDGVHLGHRRLLEVLRTKAGEAGLASVVVTFEEQPRALINPAAAVTYLATLEHRVGLLEETGPDAILPVKFDEPLRNLNAGEFLDMLRSAADVRMIVTGPGARLGHDRLGTAEVAGLASARGMQLVEVPAISVPESAGSAVSSSAIRAALSSGNVKDAARMLGRPYRIDGTVVAGDRRGRELGFPTANILPSAPVAVPAHGIYATVIRAAGQRRMAATSVGVRPTFSGDGRRLIEAYILDFEGDLYDEPVELEFVERLRDELKFDGVEPLIEQMSRDVLETREVLSGAL